MYMHKFFMSILREGEGQGGAGGNQPPANQPPANQPPSNQAAVPPWGGDVNTQWMVNGKPWYEALLPEGPTRQLYTEKKYNNPVQAADAHFSANRMVNGNAAEIPADDAKPDAWQAFNAKLRGPAVAKPEDYKFDFGKTPDGKPIAPDPRMEKFGRELAFELGMSPKRAQELLINKWQQFAGEVNAEATKAEQTANSNEVLGVQQKWGERLDEYKAAGQRVVAALGLEQPLMQKIEGAIGGAAMLELLARLGKMAPEGSFKGGNPGGDPNNIDNMTAQQAKAEIDKLGADAQFQAQYNDKNNPLHKDAVDRMAKLYAKAGALARA